MCDCVNCKSSLGRMGAISDCMCSDCTQGTPPAPIPGTTTGAGMVNTINIYNDFAPLNLDAPVYVYPDGTYSNIPPGGGTLPGTGGGGTLPPPGGGTTTPPAEEPPTSTGGSGSPAPPDDGGGIPTMEKMFPWFLLAALGYAGYQVMKEPKKQQRRKKK